MARFASSKCNGNSNQAEERCPNTAHVIDTSYSTSVNTESAFNPYVDYKDLQYSLKTWLSLTLALHDSCLFALGCSAHVNRAMGHRDSVIRKGVTKTRTIPIWWLFDWAY